MTKIMGILNVTPDSFFDRGKFGDYDLAVSHGVRLFNEGADYIDVGGESTRPWAQSVSEEEELRRVIPVIQQLSKMVEVPISIDTMKPRVAKSAIDAGATFINDVTGFKDPEMQEIALSSGATLCLMHMQGTPGTMQSAPYYPEGIVPSLLKWFDQRVEVLLQKGIDKDKIILDPGIGFGKTVDDNLQIIQNLQRLKTLGFPLLLGVSRKSFMQKILNKTADQLLPETIAVNTLLILEKIDIIRVHDVAEHRGIVDLLSRIEWNR